MTTNAEELAVADAVNEVLTEEIPPEIQDLETLTGAMREILPELLRLPLWWMERAVEIVQEMVPGAEDDEGIEEEGEADGRE